MLYELNEADVSEFDRLPDVDIANAISAGLTIAETLVPFQGWGGECFTSSSRGPSQRAEAARVIRESNRTR